MIYNPVEQFLLVIFQVVASLPTKAFSLLLLALSTLVQTVQDCNTIELTHIIIIIIMKLRSGNEIEKLYFALIRIESSGIKRGVFHKTKQIQYENC